MKDPGPIDRDHPAHIQILINGEPAYSGTYEKLYISENRERLQLIAERWQIAVLPMPDNPFLGMPTGTILDGQVNPPDQEDDSHAV